MRSFALVAAGGAAGTLARYGVDGWLDGDRLLPVATLTVNVVGSFLLGLLVARLAGGAGNADEGRTARLVLGTGFLGGFTTYSALAVETDHLLRSDHVALAVAYAAGSVLLGLVAAVAGLAAGRRAAT